MNIDVRLNYVELQSSPHREHSVTIIKTNRFRKIVFIMRIMLNKVTADGKHSYHWAFSVKRIVLIRYFITASVNIWKFWYRRCRSFWTIYSTPLIQCPGVILADRNFRNDDGECYARLPLSNTPQTITQSREFHRRYKGLQVVEGSTDKWLQ